MIPSNKFYKKSDLLTMTTGQYYDIFYQDKNNFLSNEGNDIFISKLLENNNNINFSDDSHDSGYNTPPTMEYSSNTCNSCNSSPGSNVTTDSGKTSTCSDFHLPPPPGFDSLFTTLGDKRQKSNGEILDISFDRVIKNEQIDNSNLTKCPFSTMKFELPFKEKETRETRDTKCPLMNNDVLQWTNQMTNNQVIPVCSLDQFTKQQTLEQNLNWLNQKKTPLDNKVAEQIQKAIMDYKSKPDTKIDFSDNIFFKNKYIFKIFRRILSNECPCCNKYFQNEGVEIIKKINNCITDVTKDKSTISPVKLKRKLSEILTSKVYCQKNFVCKEVVFHQNMTLREIVKLSFENGLIKKILPKMKVKLSDKTQIHPLEEIFFPNGTLNNRIVIEDFELIEFSPT